MHERILYVSRAAAGTGQAELYAIIRAAHGRNRADGLSGALVFLDGWFAQLLEGPGPAVAAAFGRIARDPRHGDLALRLRGRALCRLLPGQPMALRTRACLDPGLLETFGLGPGARPGFPVETLPADLLVEFLVRACRGAEGRAARRRRGPHPETRPETRPEARPETRPETGLPSGRSPGPASAARPDPRPGGAALDKSRRAF